MKRVVEERISGSAWGEVQQVEMSRTVVCWCKVSFFGGGRGKKERGGGGGEGGLTHQRTIGLGDPERVAAVLAELG